MAKDEVISQALGRIVKVFEKKPEAGLSTNAASCVIESGLVCRVTEGENTAIVDMVEVMGGEGTGPSPGFFGRASLISCIAIGIKMTAARSRVKFDKISVDLEMDWNDCGMFGIGDVTAGPLAIRVAIAIECDAEEDVIKKIVTEALRSDPWLLVFTNSHSIQPVISINAGTLE